jgi:hypothetical protein
MTDRINSYKELLEEKARLTMLLETQKAVLKEDFQEIKQQFSPIKNAISVIGKITTKDNNNWLLTTAADTAIDLVVKNSFYPKQVGLCESFCLSS